jgi:hypothetical protein
LGGLKLLLDARGISTAYSPAERILQVVDQYSLKRCANVGARQN